MSLSNIGNYVCECGREFTSSQAFNGHKSGCKVHQINKHGNLDKLNEHRKRVGSSVKSYFKNKNETLQKNKLANEAKILEKWILEQHKCETCGKVMTEKFGSGRFCCRSCANTRHHSTTTKSKIGSSNSEYFKSNEYKEHLIKSRLQLEEEKQLKVAEYNLNPKLCKVCNLPIPYNRKDYSTCSSECRRKCAGGLREHSGRSKSGKYNGIYCNSTYELAFLIYCLDHNIPIKRCKDYYMYEYNNCNHKYFPDFIINNTIIEIKGYYTKLVDIKAAAVNDKPILVLYRKDLKPVFEYIEDKYNKIVDVNISDLYNKK